MVVDNHLPLLRKMKNVFVVVYVSFLWLFNFSELPVYIEHLCVVSSLPLAACCSGGLTTVIRAFVCFKVLFLPTHQRNSVCGNLGWLGPWFFCFCFFQINGINVLFHCIFFIFLKSLVFEKGVL